MKRAYFLILASLFVLQLNAQTLTYSVFANTLSGSMNIKLAENSSFNVALTTTTGNGVTWNASGLTQKSGTPDVHFVYASPGSTPNGSLYPNSNYVQYDPALTSVIGYNYFNISSDSMVSWGDYSPSSEHEIYQNPDKRLVFPFSYSESFTDSYAKTNYSDASTISSYQTGTRTVTFSGFGTLILPQGAFTNVALISELRTNNLGPNSTTFTWIDITNGKQLMYYAENNGNVNAAFTSDNSTGLNELDKQFSVQVYPNPFSQSATIQIKDDSSLKDVSFVVFDMMGKEIRKTPLNSNEFILERQYMSPGIYFYHLIGESGKLKTGKIIVE